MFILINHTILIFNLSMGAQFPSVQVKYSSSKMAQEKVKRFKIFVTHRFLWWKSFKQSTNESSKTALSFWQKPTPLPSGDVMVVWTKKHKATPLLKKSTSKFGNTHEIRGICDRRKKIKTAVKTPMIGSNFGGHPHTIMDTKKEPLLDTKMH